MRLTAFLFKDIPYRFRGKYRKVKKPTFKDLLNLKHDFEREERNMLILRHPYLTIEQSHGHMKHSAKLSTNVIFENGRDKKFAKIITIEERLKTLKSTEAWD